jgi:hypothetical protein
MRLNGWQRLGVIASVVWLPVGLLGGNAWWIHANGSPSVRLLQFCLETSEATRTTWAACHRQFNTSYPAAIAGHWWAGLVCAIVPILLAWGFAWVCVRLFRWVRAGFARQQA